MEDLTVLVTAAGFMEMPGFAACLKNNGERKITIVGADMNYDPTIKQLVDKFYVVPPYDASNYIDTLLKICKEEKVDIFIPVMTEELPLVSERIQDFENIGVKVSISNGPGLLIANDKIKLYQFMSEKGFDIPNFKVVNSMEEYKNAAKFIGYPEKGFCVKASNMSGSRGIRIIDPLKSRFDVFMHEKPNSFFTTYDDMINILSEANNFPELLLMDYLPGAEYSIDLLADKGKTLYIVGRESNTINASIPQEATLAYNKEAYEIAERLTKLLQLDGNIDFDFKFDKNNQPKLMEINPRIAATLSVIAAGGVNLVYLRIKQLLGESLPKCTINYGVKLKRRSHELFCDSEGIAIKF